MTPVKSTALRQEMIADPVDRHPNEGFLTAIHRKVAAHALSRFGQPYSAQDIDLAVNRQSKQFQL